MPRKSDWWVCMPLPLMPSIGLGMNEARKPKRLATFRTTNLNVVRLSAVVSTSAYLKSISCWPMATSWCAASTSNPISSSCSMMTRRISSPRSTGPRSK